VTRKRNSIVPKRKPKKTRQDRSMPKTVTRPAGGRLPFPTVPPIDPKVAVERLKRDTEEAERRNEQTESSVRVRDEDRRLLVSM